MEVKLWSKARVEVGELHYGTDRDSDTLRLLETVAEEVPVQSSTKDVLLLQPK